jgi:antitoxin (DNA-binding transcriptional repressor) of toxin-antitoxin stability system
MADHNYSIAEAQAHFSKLLGLAEAGEEVTIWRGKTAVAKMAAFQSTDGRCPRWTDEELDELGIDPTPPMLASMDRQK